MEGSARCSPCDIDYPLRNGIGVFLPPQERPEDLWEETNSAIQRLVKNEPEKVRLLLESPVATMNPTDLFFRGLILESQQRYVEAREVRNLSRAGMYSSEQYACMKSQLDFVSSQVTDSPGPVVDLACGMGTLLETLLPKATQHVVATDFSPRVLIRDRAVFASAAPKRGLSFLALDARHTPFADHSIPTIVSYVGLSNIEDPGDLVKELRRILSGHLFAISLFYEEKAGPNADLIRQYKLDSLLYRETAVKKFEEAGFKVRVENAKTVLAQPTPKGVILVGAQTDRLPVTETRVEWGTLVAS